MAVTYQSIQTTAFTTSNVVVTKPVSLAVGDLMIGITTATAGTITVSPSGWTRLTQQQAAGNVQIIVDYIVATSTEVAATNFTWTNGSGNEATGSILRITGQHATNPLAIFAKDGAEVNVTTPTFPITVTPNNPNSLLFYCLAADSASSRTASGYAVVTDNPSWTELYDSYEPNTDVQASLAYAQRSAVTATGNATVTMSGICTAFAAIMIVVRPLLLNSTTDTITITDSKIKTLIKLITDTLSLSELVTGIKRRIWTNGSKSSSTWTNDTRH